MNGSNDRITDQNSSSNILPQLKGKLWYHIDNIAKEIEDSQGNELSHTSKFTNAIVEIVLVKLSEMINDLEAFAKHDTGRDSKLITIADFKLLLRNSPALLQLLLQDKSDGQLDGTVRSQGKVD